MKRFLLIAGLIFLLMPLQQLKAQTVKKYLTDILVNRYGSEYITGYVKPLSTTLGMGLSGAMYHRGYTKGFPRVDVGISAVYVPLPNEAKSFTSPIPGQNDVPTVFGDDQIQTDGAISGTNQDFFTLPLLQVNLGLIANLEATARFAATNVDYLGKLTIYGGGIKYGLSELLPIGLPFIDFSVQADYHKFVLSDIMDAGTFGMNFQVSGSVPVLPIDIYGGIGYDRSSLTVKSNALNAPGLTIGDITIDSENQVHYNLGVSLTLMLLNIHAAYNIGKYNYLSAGVMLVL